jgi:16S rRNA (guanine527-N7)-methyltransferase
MKSIVLYFMNTILEGLLIKHDLCDTKEKMESYISFLLAENKKYNLSGFDKYKDIVTGHIQDSLEAVVIIKDLNVSSIADIGSGCGVPGLILAIAFPDKKFYLIEVLNKRISFLNKCIKKLDIKNCTVVNKDFKTCVRKKSFESDLFLARASLKINELMFLFSGASKYQDSKLLYWGSENWKKNLYKKRKMLIPNESFNYTIETKRRVIILFNKSKTI